MHAHNLERVIDHSMHGQILKLPLTIYVLQPMHALCAGMRASDLVFFSMHVNYTSIFAAFNTSANACMHCKNSDRRIFHKFYSLERIV